MEDLTGLVAVGGSLWFAFMVVKIILDYRTKKILIDKGIIDEKVKYLSKIGNGYMSSLKWGLVLLGAGIGLIGARIFTEHGKYYRDPDEFTVGFMILLAGVGLLVYYFLAIKEHRRMKQEEKMN